MAKQKANGVLVVSSQVSNAYPFRPGRPSGPRVQQCKWLCVWEYHFKVLSKKTKNLKTMKNLKNFGKQLIQFLLSPQFAIVFIFIIACFNILILPNKNHSLDFI